MCLGDWRLGRLIAASQRSVALVVGTPFLLPASMQRVGLSVVTNASDSILGAVDITVNGVQVAFQTNFLSLGMFITVATHGVLPTYQFTINAVGGNVTVGITEWFLPEDVLQSALESLRSEYKLP